MHVAPMDWQASITMRDDVIAAIRDNSGLMCQVLRPLFPWGRAQHKAATGIERSHPFTDADDALAGFLLYMIDDAHERWRMFDPSRGRGEDSKRLVNFLALYARRFVNHQLRSARREAMRMHLYGNMVRGTVAHSPTYRVATADEYARLRRRLTPAQCDVLDALCVTGGDRPMAAQRLGMSLPALRKQMQAVSRTACRYKLRGDIR